MSLRGISLVKPGSRKFIVTISVAMGLSYFAGQTVWANEFPYSYNNFGGIGLLDMRTARFSPDGTVAIGVQYNSQSTRYFSTWQATPWFETSLSYSDDNPDELGVDRSLDFKIRLLKEGNIVPQVAVGVQDALGSGRYGAEYIVASKRYYDFDFTMGFSWGYLGSRGGLDNMFRLFGDNFNERSAASSSGGVRSGSYFSGHDMSFFAGAEYFPPIPGLSLKVEYSGVDTKQLSEFSNLKRNSAFNIGLNYKPLPWVDVAVGLDYGDRFGVRLTFKQNINTLKFPRFFKDQYPTPILDRKSTNVSDDMLPKVTSRIVENDRLFNRLRRLGVKVVKLEQLRSKMLIDVKVLPDEKINHMVLLGAVLESYDQVTLRIFSEPEKANVYDTSKNDTVGRAALEKYKNDAVYLREKAELKSNDMKSIKITKSAFDSLNKSDLSPESVTIQNQTATVVKNVGPYSKEAKNIGRTARILTREMPDFVEVFSISSQESGLETSHVSVMRQDLEKANDFQGSPEEIWVNSTIKPPGEQGESHAPGDITYQSSKSIKFDWGIKPELLSHFGGNSDGRFRKDLYAKLYGAVDIGNHLRISAEFKQYLFGDLDKVPQDMAPNIPKVRSDISRYSAEGRSAINSIKMDYTIDLGSSFYSRISGGLFESMYGGLGADILYRPYNRNIAIGLDMNWVKQRDYNQLFSFRDYDTVTGHATLYYENTTYNITSKLSVGRYLAGDYGGTIDISRRFANGMTIGVWATVTDMPSEKFGDGSFDKGIYLTMPLEIFWYRPSRENIRFNFRSLGKNGGQKLERGKGLYDILSSGRQNRLSQEWQEILE